MRCHPFLPILALAALALSACQQESLHPASPALTPPPLPAGVVLDSGDLLAAQFDIAVDPAELTATVLPVRSGAAQPPQNLQFDFDIEQFTKPSSFRIEGVRLTDAGDFEIEFTHAHPFPAPDFSSGITALNRADLGYTGRLLLLVSGTATAFFGGSVQLNPESVVAADGWLQPGTLLAAGPQALNTFPYVLLADEAKNNREGISNGGVMTGSYNAGQGGWQRANAGPSGTGWTGFDYVHGGQVVRNRFALGARGLAGSGFTFRAALLIKYTDPRGMAGRTLRFPPELPDATQFAYRLPYAALDISRITLSGPLSVIDTPAGDTADIILRIRDWDARATAAASHDLGALTDVTLVQPGAPGTPTVELVCPPLFSSSLVLTAGNPSNSGRPNDELTFTGTLTNVLGTAAPGRTFACVQITDPEDGDPNASSYRYGVDPFTITPDPARALQVRTWQVLPVTIRTTMQAPVVVAVSPTGIVGSTGGSAQFSASLVNSASDWVWDFGTGASPSISNAATPSVTLGAPGTYAASVTASNAAGSSPTYIFAYTVQTPAPSWDIHQVNTNGPNGTGADLLMFNGRPAISYFSSIEGALMVSVANVDYPAQTSHWTTMQVDGGEGVIVGKQTSIAVSNGRLAVSYYDETNGDLKLARSLVDNPTTPAHWGTYAVDQLLDTGRDSSLADQNGKLAITYYAVTGQALRCVRALVDHPTDDPTHWVFMVLDANDDAGLDSSLVDFSGRLAVTYYNTVKDTLRIAIAANTAPVNDTDWAIHTIDDNAIVGEESSLAVFNNRLAVSYDMDRDDDLRFARALIELPTKTDDWMIQTVDAIGNTGERTSLLYYDDRPVIVYHDKNNLLLRMARGLTAEPLVPTDWQLVTITGSMEREDTGIAVLADGTFGVIYQAGGGNKTLNFAKASVEW